MVYFSLSLSHTHTHTHTQILCASLFITFFAAGSDFIIEAGLIFNSSTSYLCHEVTLIDDNISEETEFFLIDFSSFDDNVLFGPVTEVMLLDEDSKYRKYNYSF